jgi:cation diffusion facilitator family transporter
MNTGSSKRVLYAALIGNLLVAVTKFGAAYFTGSSAMLSEAVHSLVDTGNQVLLLYGLRRAARSPDEAHPLGYGRELYFWSFIVSLLVFALGAGVSFYEGVRHLWHPVEISNPQVSYLVLALSALFEGASWRVALREFRKAKGELGYLKAVEESKDPTRFMVLFEDSAALLGLAIAFLGTWAAHTFHLPILDGIASIAIGLLLGGVAAILVRETKGLLLGEAAHSHVATSICRAAREQPGVEHANDLLTVQLGPRQVVAALSVEFADRLTVPEVEAIVNALEQRVRREYPEIVMLLVKPQSRIAFQESRERRFRAEGFAREPLREVRGQKE